MRILLVSLQRLGDLQIHRLLIPAVQKKYPTAAIYFLVNDSVYRTQNELPEISGSLISFPRESLLSAWATNERSLVDIYNTCSRLADEVQELQFDLIYNLTFSKIAYHLCQVFANFAPTKNLYFLEEEIIPGGHLLELIARKHEIAIPVASSATSAGVSRVLLQPLTNDPKKNWPIQNWVSLSSQLSMLFPWLGLKVLCASFEYERLKDYFRQEDLLEIGWQQLEASLGPGDLVVTGDTSIQHLAVLKNVPLVSLFLGSGDPERYGPYQSDAIILKGSSDCYPCSPRLECPFSPTACSSGIKIEDVLSAIQQKIRTVHQPREAIDAYGI